MRTLLLMLGASAAPAWAHHSPIHLDVVCIGGDTMPGLALLPFLALVAVGIVRAVIRHRKDR
jgi:hypothetical protein